MTTDVPLFLLQTVLFPGGRLNARVFEKRYLDMITACLKTDRPFGVCLIKRGNEVGPAAEPHDVGALARVVECDMDKPGILQIVVRGTERFRIRETRIRKDQLLVADVEPLTDTSATIVGRHERLIDALKRVLEQAGDDAYFAPPQWQDAAWVSGRLAELLPLPLGLKQALLEIDDISRRLDVLAELFPVSAAGQT
jgi:uncharacterized protein